MSVAAAQRSYEAFARGDLDAVLADMDEGSSGSRRRGCRTAAPTTGSPRCGRTSSTRSTGTGGRSSRPSRHEFLDAGDEVIVLGRYRGVAKETGKLLDVPFVHVWSFRDGKAWRFRQFLDTAGWVEALSP